MKTILSIGAVVALLIGGVWWTNSLAKSDPDVLARNGMHSHPTLAIYVKGEKQEIPANIGIGATHSPMHTHTEDAAQGVVHLEFSGMVRTEDAMLGEFFKNWGKDMRSFGSNMRMTVNGVENTEYERYIMRDKDVIELHYE
ncbi:MAG: hypothetical protein AAB908_03060 [Patescibacteria group bacterium]